MKIFEIRGSSIDTYDYLRYGQLLTLEMNEIQNSIGKDDIEYLCEKLTSIKRKMALCSTSIDHNLKEKLNETTQLLLANGGGKYLLERTI
jgi:hypothetical protein